MEHAWAVFLKRRFSLGAARTQQEGERTLPSGSFGFLILSGQIQFQMKEVGRELPAVEPLGKGQHETGSIELYPAPVGNRVLSQNSDILKL